MSRPNEISGRNEETVINQEWPRLDPVTNRMICHNCWNTLHYKKDIREAIVDACDGECDCVHRSEETWAAIERQNKKNNRKELRRNLKEQLEDPNNPLVAHNDSFKPKKKGKAHA